MFTDPNKNQMMTDDNSCAIHVTIHNHTCHIPEIFKQMVNFLVTWYEYHSTGQQTFGLLQHYHDGCAKLLRQKEH